jgi:GNAT superfamily N-acetyltransferase
VLPLTVRPVSAEDRDWIVAQVSALWGSDRVVSRGKVHHPAGLPGFIATVDGDPAGLVTYQIEGDACEVVTLHAVIEGVGAGQALLEAVAGVAREAGCRRLWLITTNDNTPALRFYQKRGWRLVAVHADVVTVARRTLKPEIPLQGIDGIPIRDEIELELPLG